jgi:hypothetical protein
LKFLTLFITSLIVALGSFAGSAFASVTSVGNAGHGVYCHVGGFFGHDRVALLDFVLAKSRDPRYRVELGKRHDSVKKKVEIALRRLPVLFPDLTARELKEVRTVSRRLQRAVFIEITNPLPINTSLLETEDADLNLPPGYVDCRLEPIAVKPLITKKNQRAYQSMCKRLFLSIDECVSFDIWAWMEMNRDNKAGLIVHEATRFLPERLRPRNQNEVRQLTARLCGPARAR